MKRQIFTLLLIFTFISNLVTAQDAKDWGEWRTTKCFKGIQFRTRPMGTEPGKYGYSRYIQFKNNYNTKVAFGYTVKGFQKEHDEYVQIHGSQYRTELKANSTDDGLMWFSSTNANGQYISLGYLRFLGIDETDASKTFEGCDDRTAIVCNSCNFKPTYWCSNYDKSKNKNQEPKITTPTSSISQEQIKKSIIEDLKINLNQNVRFNDGSFASILIKEITLVSNNMTIITEHSYSGGSRGDDSYQFTTKKVIPIHLLKEMKIEDWNDAKYDRWGVKKMIILTISNENVTQEIYGGRKKNLGWLEDRYERQGQVGIEYVNENPSNFIRFQQLINQLGTENSTQPNNDKVDEAKKKEQEMQNNAVKLDKEMKIIGNYLSQLPKEERSALIDNANDIVFTQSNKQNAIIKLIDLKKKIENINVSSITDEYINQNIQYYQNLFKIKGITVIVKHNNEHGYYWLDASMNLGYELNKELYLEIMNSSPYPDSNSILATKFGITWTDWSQKLKPK